MSAFLGPIHYWLYNKIVIQNSIVEDIITFANSNQLNANLAGDLDERFGFIELKPLEELIDTTNIHGWLQDCVAIVEYRLAYAVTSLLKEDSNYLENLKDLFKNAGIRVSSLGLDSGIEEIYKKLSDSLLDGMPCDHANTVISQDETEVVWKRNVCVHKQYWDFVGGDIQNYYLLRDELIKGLISNTATSYEKMDEITSAIRIK